MTDDLSVGIVGIGGRGQSLKAAFDAHSSVRVSAVCDQDRAAARRGKDLFDADTSFEEYETMLETADIDTVVIGTPAPYHVSQSIEALERDLHVLSEVPAGVDIGECRDLVHAVADSRGEYLMMENFIYLRSNEIISGMVDSGIFGEIYYAEAEYLHELRTLNEQTPWRREWQTGINGITYPTHSLGPILKWMGDDRITRVTCAGSGHHHVDPRGHQYEIEDTTVMIAETEQDHLLKLRLDMVSDRPDAIDNYQFQATGGCYESARKRHEYDAVWLEAREDADDSRQYEWIDLESFSSEHLPSVWDTIPDDFPGGTDSEESDGGLAFRDSVLIADYVMMTEFIEALTNGENPPVGIHYAMDLTLPGLVSQQSISEDGRWLNVPDSRTWV